MCILPLDTKLVTLEELEARREAIMAIARRHGARDVRVFGSVVRGEADSASDVDFLVELEPGRSLLDLGGLHMDLQEHLRCMVDVMTLAMLKPRAQACAARGHASVRSDTERLAPENGSAFCRLEEGAGSTVCTI